MKRVPLYLFALSLLAASTARAQKVSYVLVPTITSGVTVTKVELARTDLSLSNVQATFIREGTSGLGATPKTLKAYIGPSTSRTSPLVDLTPVVTGGGMVVLQPTPGLDAVEVSFEIEQSPIRTAWKLPMLAASDFFNAGATVYVQNLVKNVDASARLQIFNPGIKPAICKVTVLRPRGTALDERTGIAVPAVGSVVIADILKQVATGTAAGINAAVTCDQPFYPMASLPATNRWESRVEFPTTQAPGGARTNVTVENRKGEFLRVTKSNSFLNIPLSLDPSTTYHSLAIDFDLTTADPPDFVVFRNVVGLFRTGGRRFGKTLYFGSFENFDKGKYVIDFGSPYIETTVKRPINLSGRGNYHFSITLDNDQKSLHYVITNLNKTVLYMDVLGGLYNPISAVGGNLPTIQFGLPGVADNAYFPPYGWHFSNLSIVAVK
jgi:hypothetical protein